MTNDTTSQATLEKVRELMKDRQNGEWSLGTSFDFDPAKRAVVVDVGSRTMPVFGYEGMSDHLQQVCNLHNAFPSIASLVESQVKRIEELEKEKQMMKNNIYFHCKPEISQAILSSLS